MSHAEEKRLGVTKGTLPTAKHYSYKILKTYPHDADAFTQGLVFDQGNLFEGTGLQGRSSLRRVELETGKILQIIRLPDPNFGEGITVFRDKIIQLTWKAKLVYVYDKTSFELLQQFSYDQEGWGITHDGVRLILSDGTSILRFRDPEDLSERGRIQVYDEKGPVGNLNELEYIDGEIYANVWRTQKIARIDPHTGCVTGWIDLEGIYQAEGPAKPVDVLNGIAYDSKNHRIFVTGKLWPSLFEIKLEEGDRLQ
jgi:glutaminyl-peptide cyclotransferase